MFGGLEVKETAPTKVKLTNSTNIESRGATTAAPDKQGFTEPFRPATHEHKYNQDY